MYVSCLLLKHKNLCHSRGNLGFSSADVGLSFHATRSCMKTGHLPLYRWSFLKLYMCWTQAIVGRETQYRCLKHYTPWLQMGRKLRESAFLYCKVNNISLQD